MLKWIKISGCVLKYDPDRRILWAHQGKSAKLVKAINLAILKGCVPKDLECLVIYEELFPDVPMMLRGPNLITFLVAGPEPRQSNRTLFDIINSSTS